ncbi:MAG: endonuclease/exonuclease/phosphatase family protein [Eubacteriales bacterium]|nr:endonuclease/exonuclease/phosphatase family protein [Eubacteriales bacterium]
MRIATYNIWNDENGLADRYAQIAGEICDTDADIIGLQEVTPDRYAQLRGTLPYAHAAYAKYADEDEGLAVFSKHELCAVHPLTQRAGQACCAALTVLIRAGGFVYCVTNVHLPWASILEKERQIVAIDAFLQQQKDAADFFILLGDFNCTPVSSVQLYLLGEMSLHGCQAQPTWFDVAANYAARTGTDNRPTLDFYHNPRWSGANTVEIPAVFDRILIRYSQRQGYAQRIERAALFGTRVSHQTKMAASDHYGVLADVIFHLTR